MKRQPTLLIVGSHINRKALQKHVDPKAIFIVNSCYRSLIGMRFENALITRDALLEMSNPMMSSETHVKNAQRWLAESVSTRLVEGGQILHI